MSKKLDKNENDLLPGMKTSEKSELELNFSQLSVEDIETTIKCLKAFGCEQCILKDETCDSCSCNDIIESLEEQIVEPDDVYLLILPTEKKEGKHKRIHRKNQREKLPPGSKFVGRPSRWGNPFKVAIHGRKTALKMYTQWLENSLIDDPQFLEPLRGYHLACYCPPDQSCHADILLDFLNKA